MKQSPKAIIVLMASSSIMIRTALSYLPNVIRRTAIPSSSRRFVPRAFHHATTHLRSTTDETTETPDAAAAAAAIGYPFKDVEDRWQSFWDENDTFKTPERDHSKEKKFVLDMFPYPSGAGLHVGHPEGYTGTLFWEWMMD